MADFLTDGGPEPTQSTPIDVAPPGQLPPGDVHAAGRAEAGEEDDDDDDFLFSGAQPASLGASGAFSSVGSGGDGGFGLGATRLVVGGGGAVNGRGAAGAPAGAGASVGATSDGAAATAAAGGGRSSYFGGGVAYRGGASFLDDSDAGTDSDDDGDGPGGGGGGDGGGGGTYLSGTGLNGLSGGRRRPFRPQTIKHFILGDVLGEGSYAKVREGIDSASLRIVAVKVIDLRFLRKVRAVRSAALEGGGGGGGHGASRVSRGGDCGCGGPSPRAGGVAGGCAAARRTSLACGSCRSAYGVGPLMLLRSCHRDTS